MSHHAQLQSYLYCTPETTKVTEAQRGFLLQCCATGQWGAERKAVELDSSPRAIVGQIKCALTTLGLQKATVSVSCCYKCYCPPPPTPRGMLCPKWL